jgi:hypothetical protein
MAITVYWSSLEDEWLRAKEPEAVYKDFLKDKKNFESTIAMCPAVKDYTKNTFSLKSIYDYEFEINKDLNDVTSQLYDQVFFNKHVEIRSIENKFFSFSQRLVFFTEEQSLNMSLGILPYFEDNEITKRCTLIPGKLDIGKWFRIIDYAFFLKNNINSFKINEGDVYQYIKLETDQKIEFKQFKSTDLIYKYILDITSSKNHRKPKIRDLSEFYEIMRHKKYIIKEIKNNLL